MTPYTRKDLECDIQEHRERIQLDLRNLDSEAKDGSLEDAKRRADRRHELRTRARELEGRLAESKAKRSDGGRLRLSQGSSGG
jgi:hypothetical protein